MLFSQWKMWDSLAHTYGYDAPRNQMRYFLYDAPVYGNYLRFEQGWKDANDYLKNHGLSWADAYRVGNMPGAGSPYTMLTSPLKNTNYVSKNIMSLYDESRRRSRSRRNAFDPSPELAMEMEQMGYKFR